MNRTDRLYALVEELRARAPRPVRAAALASRFEVSTRTIERDLLALQAAGVPIWAQPGPGGGYGLNVEATLPPLNLTVAEATALATALAAGGAGPFAAAGQSALAKLSAVMAAGPRASAAKLTRQIRVKAAAADPDPASPVLSVVQEALVTSVALELTYADRDGRHTVRIVEPGGLVGTGFGWYLPAFCRLRQAPRIFRLDRIAAARLTGELITPPPLDAMLRDLPYVLAEPTLT